MAQMLVRKLDDEIVRRLKLRAAENGRSAEAELRAILEAQLGSTASPSFWDAAAQLRARQKMRPAGSVLKSLTAVRTDMDRR